MNASGLPLKSAFTASATASSSISSPASVLISYESMRLSSISTTNVISALTLPSFLVLSFMSWYLPVLQQYQQFLTMRAFSFRFREAPPSVSEGDHLRRVDLMCPGPRVRPWARLVQSVSCPAPTVLLLIHRPTRDGRVPERHQGR